jgi:uncharacterized protein (TIGR03086 family)
MSPSDLFMARLAVPCLSGALPMDPVTNLARALAGARTRIATVSPGDLEKPTSCADWNVGALVQHMLAVAVIYGRAFGSEESPPLAAPGGGTVTAEGLSSAYGQAADNVLTAARVPGALDGTVKLTSIDLPGQLAIRLLVAEQLLHSWDLAQGIGQPFAMDESLASETLDGLREVLAALPGVRGAGRAFGEEVPCPADAPIQDRLLAFAGRQP